MLAELVRRLATALDADDIDPSLGADVGAAMVRARFTRSTVLTRSAAVLAELPDHLDRYSERTYRLRLTELIGALGEGYAEALQQQTFDEQEAILLAITEARRDAERASATSETRFRAIYDHAPVAILVGGTDGHIVDANTALCALLGRSVDELRSIPVFDFLHPEDLPEVRRKVYRELIEQGCGTVRFETRFRTAAGGWKWGSLAITYVPGVGDQAGYLLAVGEDISERRRLQAELHHQSRHDPLTGLPNRLRLREALAAAIAAAGPDDHAGLCFLDLDGFKDVNDRYGHGVGDKLLAAVAARLGAKAAGDDHLLARIGGDEFVALIQPPVDDEAVIATAERLITALAVPFAVDGHQVQVSASVGITAPLVAGADPETLIDAADVGLYRAKADRRGRWAQADLA